MKELNECLKTSEKIDKINERIEELRTLILSPKGQNITGMPRSSETRNNFDTFLVKLENLENKKDKLSNYQWEQWAKVRKKAFELGIEEEKIRLLFLRFVRGYSWNECLTVMQKEYSGWNINKVYRTYRYLLAKLKNVQKNN